MAGAPEFFALQVAENYVKKEFPDNETLVDIKRWKDEPGMSERVPPGMSRYYVVVYVQLSKTGV